MTILEKYIRDKSDATAVEYGLIGALMGGAKALGESFLEDL